MTIAKAGSVPPPGQAASVKRRFRNYLLDPAFQLRYTGMVVAVTFLIASGLGYVAYGESRAQTEMLTVNMALAGETADFIEATAEAADRELLLKIVMGILILVVSLGFTGILVTHRVVGPAYKLKSLFRDVAQGHLRVYGRLRKGDELWDVFDEFEKMIIKLRANQRGEIDRLDSVIAQAVEAGTSEAVVAQLNDLRARMEAEIAD